MTLPLLVFVMLYPNARKMEALRLQLSRRPLWVQSPRTLSARAVLEASITRRDPESSHWQGKRLCSWHWERYVLCDVLHNFMKRCEKSNEVIKNFSPAWTATWPRTTPWTPLTMPSMEISSRVSLPVLMHSRWANCPSPDNRPSALRWV